MTRATRQAHDNAHELHKVSLSPDIWMDCSMPVTKEFINHMLNQNNPIPWAVVLHARIDPFTDYDAPNREMLALQQLFFACPNLQSFFLSLHGNYGGCIIRVVRFPQIHSFELTGRETFPPLKELSLNGYQPSIEESVHWRNRFPWSGLVSLKLGPQRNVDFLELANSHVISLRNLTVETYYDQSEDDCLPLEGFLRSFNTLESLTVKGHFLSSGAFSNHTGLKHFCLHTIESPRSDETRLTLGGIGLYDLDINCPQLESLELDVQRDGEWPEDILGILATGFENLLQLTLHFEVGIRDDYVRPHHPGRESEATYAPIEPVLNLTSAKELGRAFFTWRSTSKLQTLTLKAGESLRRFPQMAPFFFEWEESYSRHYILHAPLNPGEEPQMEDLTKINPYILRCSQAWMK